MAEAFGQSATAKVEKIVDTSMFYHTFEQKDPTGLPESSYNASKKLKEPNKTTTILNNEGLVRRVEKEIEEQEEVQEKSYLNQAIKSSEFSLFTVFAKDQLVHDTDLRGNT